MTAVVFLSGRSGNDALGAAGRAHRPLFEALGHQFIEVDLSSAAGQQLLTRTIQGGPIEFVYSVMGMGADLRGATPDGQERNLWEGLGIPFLSLKGDSPAYFFDRHVLTSPWHASLYFFPEHLELRKRLKPALAPALYGTIPPIPFDMTDKADIDFGKKEGGRLLFLKNGNDPDQLVRAWRDAMPTSAFLLLSELASELASNVAGEAGDDIDALVTRYLADKGWDVEAFVRLRLFFVAQLDDYLRRIKSTLVADVLADFPVDIRGINWEHMNFSGRRASYAPGWSYAETREHIANALGVVDMSPNTQRAPHDRAMRAFGLYTLCVTNEQRFLREAIEGADRFTYRFDREELRERIANVLAHPKRYVEIGVDAAEQFRRDRHPMQFAQFLVDTAGLVRLACSGRREGLPPFFVWPPTKTA